MTSEDAVRVALDAAGYPAVTDPLRETIFREVLRAELAKGASGQRTKAGSDVHAATNTSPISQLAQKWAVEAATIEDLYEFSDDSVNLAVDPSRLAPSRSAATEQIAYLVCAARQGGLGEAETSADAVRKVCADYGKYDESNFAASLKALTGNAFFGGTKRARTIRLNRAGFERAKQLALEIVGAT